MTKKDAKLMARAINECQAYRHITEDDVWDFMVNDKPTGDSNVNFVLSVIEAYYRIIQAGNQIIKERRENEKV